jgi:hypothetical protein
MLVNDVIEKKSVDLFYDGKIKKRALLTEVNKTENYFSD